jgi:NADPH:quinone reductase-like Zn-dependent oxidoreductase
VEKVVFYKKSNFVEETLDWTAGRGVDLAIDLVGQKHSSTLSTPSATTEES